MAEITLKEVMNDRKVKTVNEVITVMSELANFLLNIKPNVRAKQTKLPKYLKIKEI